MPFQRKGVTYADHCCLLQPLSPQPFCCQRAHQLCQALRQALRVLLHTLEGLGAVAGVLQIIVHLQASAEIDVSFPRAQGPRSCTVQNPYRAAMQSHQQVRHLLHHALASPGSQQPAGHLQT